MTEARCHLPDAHIALSDRDYVMVRTDAKLSPGSIVVLRTKGLPRVGRWWPATSGVAEFAEFVDPWNPDGGTKAPERLLPEADLSLFVGVGRWLDKHPNESMRVQALRAREPLN